MSGWIKVTVVLHSLDPPRFGLRHPFSNSLITVYKAVPGSAFDPSSRLWHFPLNKRSEVLNRVRSVAGTEIEDLPPFVDKLVSSIQRKDDADKVARQEMEDEVRHRMESVPDALMSTLYPFQVRCLLFAIKNKGRLLIGDEMGLGKTLQALAIACAYREDWPLLVIAPSSLRANWQKEASKWVPGLTAENTQVVKDGKEGVRDSAVLVIVSYDLAARMVDKSMLWKGQFQLIVADESHYLKSVDAKRSQAIVPLMQKAARAICVTGTPALSRPAELFMQLNALMPECFRSFHPFAVRYCAAFQGPFGLNVSGSSNTAELKMVLEEAVMIRRLKEQVLPDMLPEKDRQIVDVPCDAKVMKEVKDLMEQKAALNDALSSVTDDAEKGELLGSLQTISRQLYSLSGKAKVKGVLAHLKEMLLTAERDQPQLSHGSSSGDDDDAAPSCVSGAPANDGGTASTAGRVGQREERRRATSKASRRAPSSQHGVGLGAFWNTGRVGGDTSTGSGDVGGGDDKEWACSRCTYLNPTERPKCDICGAPRSLKGKVAAAGEVVTGAAACGKGGCGGRAGLSLLEGGRREGGSAVASRGEPKREGERGRGGSGGGSGDDDDDEWIVDSDESERGDNGQRRERHGGVASGGDGGKKVLRVKRRLVKADDGEDSGIDCSGSGGSGGGKVGDEWERESSGDETFPVGRRRRRRGGPGRRRRIKEEEEEEEGGSHDSFIARPSSRSYGASRRATRRARGGERAALSIDGLSDSSNADGMVEEGEEQNKDGEDEEVVCLGGGRRWNRGREDKREDCGDQDRLGVGRRRRRIARTIAPQEKGSAGTRSNRDGKGGLRRCRGDGGRYGDAVSSDESDLVDAVDEGDGDSDDFIQQNSSAGKSAPSAGGKGGKERASGNQGGGGMDGRGSRERKIEGVEPSPSPSPSSSSPSSSTSKAKAKEPRKLIVFAHHKQVMDALESGLKKLGVSSLRIDGGTAQKKRQPIVDRFQETPSVSVILLSITAAGVGITLTAASVAVFAELYWTPGSMAQAEDRIHRIGQKAKTVLIRYLIGRGTMDDLMIPLIHRKQTTLRSTVGLNRDAGGYSNVPGREHRLRSPGNTPSPAHRPAPSVTNRRPDHSQRKLEFAPVAKSDQPQQQQQQQQSPAGAAMMKAEAEGAEEMGVSTRCTADSQPQPGGRDDGSQRLSKGCSRPPRPVTGIGGGDGGECEASGCGVGGSTSSPWGHSLPHAASARQAGDASVLGGASRPQAGDDQPSTRRLSPQEVGDEGKAASKPAVATVLSPEIQERIARNKALAMQRLAERKKQRQEQQRQQQQQQQQHNSNDEDGCSFNPSGLSQDSSSSSGGGVGRTSQSSFDSRQQRQPQHQQQRQKQRISEQQTHWRHQRQAREQYRDSHGLRLNGSDSGGGGGGGYGGGVDKTPSAPLPLSDGAYWARQSVGQVSIGSEGVECARSGDKDSYGSGGGGGGGSGSIAFRGVVSENVCKEDGVSRRAGAGATGRVETVRDAPKRRPTVERAPARAPERAVKRRSAD